MNQTQRKFLINKIEENVKNQIKALDDAIPEPPSLGIYLLHAVMSGNFEIKSNEQIKEMILQKALNTKERDDWMGNSWGRASKDEIFFKIKEFFVVPEEYTKRWEEYRERRKKLEDEINHLRVQSDSLITRIQLASDKTLQTMINEVDDMGNISLMDTKLRTLGGGATKLIDEED